MKSEILTRFDQPWLPLTAFLIFLTIFVVMVLLIYRKESRKLYQEISLYPLSEGEKDE